MTTDSNDSSGVSEVEQFLKATQSKLGGNVQWIQLPPQVQLRYIDAVNVILEIAALKV